MKHFLRSLALVALASAALFTQAQTPTWSDDVACIVYSHCTTCHHEGGAGHFSLTTYGDAYGRRSDMRDATQIRYMPPWPPDAHYRSFAHERTLTQAEIDIIAAWANAGGPEGIPGNAPPPPVYTTETVITSPDITARMEDFVVPASTQDLYRCFVMPINNPTDRFITGFEVIPGNTAIVHHVLVYQDTTGEAQALDDADPAPGYTSFGGIGVSGAKLVGFWVPGAQPYFTPAGMGIKLLAGADLVMQVHYPQGSDAALDSTRINLQLSTNPFIRNMGIDPFLDHIYAITDGPLVIPPDQVKTFHSAFTSPIPATITAIAPHAHLVCTSMKSYAVTPTNDTIPLVDIPRWDFRWQGLYEFRKPIFLPTGTVLHGEAVYDNTAANLNNPNDPPAWVTLGEATTDEMMLFYFGWTYGLQSDTNIVVDTTAHAGHYLDCDYNTTIGVTEMTVEEAAHVWPTPARDVLNVDWRLAPAELRLIDADGRLVQGMRMVKGLNTVAVAQLSRGAYVMEVRGDDGRLLHRTKVMLE